MKRTHPWFIAAAALLFTNISAAQDWPRFRGPNGSGVSDTTGLPAEFGPTKDLLWKTAVPFGRSSPVIAGNRVFMTSSEGDKLIVMCLERTSGRILWRREIARMRATPVYKANDPASPSPVTDGKNVYAFFADLGLISFAADGKERWRMPLCPFDTFYGLGASPVLAGDMVLLLCDTRTNAFLLAVEARSGRVRWRVERKETLVEGYASPVLWEAKGQPAQVIVLGTHRIDAYTLDKGERVWWVRGLASMPIGSPVLGNGLVHASTWGSDTPAGPTFDEWLKSDKNGDGRLSPEEVKPFDEFGFVDRNSDGFIERAE
jgi:outer membrane protein assembly factor BamB